ncbi:MAG: hypothetical protein JHC85_05305 [Chthoniobacterales bacterium]|nr:hypothetical protein [Chthoniobacterales bacterium]
MPEEIISREEQEARAAFSTMPATGPQWRAIRWFVSDQLQIETYSALQANLSNESRQFNAGRAAGVADLLNALDSAHADVFEL